MELTEEFTLHHSTGHIAMMYFDRALSTCTIEHWKWQRLAVVCLILAAKSEEREEDVPTLEQLQGVTPVTMHELLEPKMYRREEMWVLFLFDWQMPGVCALHCVDYFLAAGVLYNSDRWRSHAIIESVPQYVRKYALFFTTLSQQDERLLQFRPSLVAAAVVRAARRALAISPAWPDELARLTAYARADVDPAYTLLWSGYEQGWPSNAAQAASDDAAPGRGAHAASARGGAPGAWRDDDAMMSPAAAAAAPYDAAASAVFKPVNVPALPREFSPKAVMDFGVLTPEEPRARCSAAAAPVDAMRD